MSLPKGNTTPRDLRISLITKERAIDLKKMLSIIGVVLIVGAIGSEQTGAIGFGQAIVQSIVGLLMFVLGVL